MKKKMDLHLNTKSLEEAAKKLLNLSKELDKVVEKALDEASELAYTEIQKNHDAIPYKDGNNDYKVFKEKIENGYKVGARGSQVLYDEFGTGTEGLKSDHSNKLNEYNLKDYNSGRTIRTAGVTIPANKGILTGELYWTYKDKETGEIVYTQGIPAGKEVFNAEKTTRENAKKILSKKVSDVLSKL